MIKCWYKETMNVQLRLKRVETSQDALAFDPKKHIPDHSAEAALSLYLIDVLECPMSPAARKATEQNLRSLVVQSRPVMLKKLHGKSECTLRLAAFTLLMRIADFNQTEARVSEALTWAEMNGLRASVRDIPTTLSDLLFSLEALMSQWERLSEDAWQDAPYQWGNTGACLEGYLKVLWSLCAKLIFLNSSDNPTSLLDASAFVLPYASETSSSGHELGVHTKTVVRMCEIWRFVEHERSVVFDVLPSTSFPEYDEQVFLRVFEFEKNQLKVDKFRENLRKRLVSRFLFAADTQITEGEEGKEMEPDAVMGKQCLFHMPGYMQVIAMTWTFEEMQAFPAVRDELYRAMADAAFSNKIGFSWSDRFYVVRDKTTPRLVPTVTRYAHAYIVAHENKAKTYPVPFATAFRVWSKMVHSIKPYNVDMSDITKFF